MRLVKIPFVIVLISLLYAPSLALESGPIVDELDGKIEFDLLWEQYVGLTTFRTTIQFHDDKVFIGTNGDTYGGVRDRNDGVYVLDPDDGGIIKHIRSYRAGDRDVNGIAINDEYFYFGDDNNYFYCYDHKYHSIWRIRAEGDIEGAPVLADFNRDGSDDVCFATEAGEVIAVDGLTGEDIWKFQAKREPDEWEWPESNSFIASPALYDVSGDDVEDVLIGSRNGNFYALHGRKGNVLWQYRMDVPSGIHASAFVLVEDGKPLIYIAESYSIVHVLDTKGREVWNVEFENPTIGIEGLFSSPVICPDGTLAIGTSWWGDADGLWLHREHPDPESMPFTMGTISATAFIADVLGTGSVQAGFVTEGGELALFGPAAMEMTAKFPLAAGGEATPLVADVNGDGELEILIATYDGYLRCYATGSGGEVVWGNFRGDLRNSGVCEY